MSVESIFLDRSLNELKGLAFIHGFDFSSSESCTFSYKGICLGLMNNGRLDFFIWDANREYVEMFKRIMRSY